MTGWSPRRWEDTSAQRCAWDLRDTLPCLELSCLTAQSGTDEPLNAGDLCRILCPCLTPVARMLYKVPLCSQKTPRRADPDKAEVLQGPARDAEAALQEAEATSGPAVDPQPPTKGEYSNTALLAALVRCLVKCRTVHSMAV